MNEFRTVLPLLGCAVAITIVLGAGFVVLNRLPEELRGKISRRYSRWYTRVTFGVVGLLLLTSAWALISR